MSAASSSALVPAASAASAAGSSGILAKRSFAVVDVAPEDEMIAAVAAVTADAAAGEVSCRCSASSLTTFLMR